MKAKRFNASHPRVGAFPGQILLCLCVGFCALIQSAFAGAAAPWQAGVATAVITPEEPMWMAGYAARTKPAEGKVHDLNAKALVLADAQGNRLAIVTLDLLGIDRAMRDWIEERLEQRYNIAPRNLLINASHTHSGPVIRESAYSIYGHSFYNLTPEQLEQSNAYSDRLQQQIVELVGDALERLAPARLGYTHARAGFAMNRRRPTARGVINSPHPDGPVDHAVPVLRVESPEGQLRAILFGYACHSTTLSFYQYCGDYPGFAQA
ncbi:MAG: neutral/alkaline non-lysosomal ceramidase N-terminal domain-containing protein, partial [Phycisphaerales bacterium]